jgi:UDP-3-O-[3-hydroxymyristoyl] N-acetylglucosamine deacetylase
VPIQQKTLEKPVAVEGFGVHTGAPTTLTLKPAKAYTGLVFCSGGVQIPARWDYVTSTTLCTTLGNAASVSISTVEHLLSALCALGVDNAYLEVSGPEVPILDGSSALFVEMIDRAGILSLPAPRQYLKIKKTVRVESGSAYVQLEPSSSGFHLDLSIDFSPHSIGFQRRTLSMKSSDYRTLIASARTFGFIADVMKLRAQGLAQGASLENSLVYDEGGPVNVPRFSDECVRHKLLDMVGDLALAGYPIQGLCRAVRSGHRLNVAALQELFSDRHAYEIVEWNQVSDRSLHVYPSAPLCGESLVASSTAMHLHRECA